MSHPDPTQDYPVKCGLCDNQAEDCLDFDAGNNAEIPVSVNLCEDHLKEEEKMGAYFQSKYGTQIDRLAYDRLVDQADGLRG